ncbi:hypothetical protein NPIL_625201 [Nephila pilipes]|uniref:BTB domain-containing protein n=1 Tax=Nephila pilipes TaxID=299642 RepID=A0A8X6PSJ7_NEPPI|nr:hypothetical protein NPIL_625201 [Nephila pilipes]
MLTRTATGAKLSSFVWNVNNFWRLCNNEEIKYLYGSSLQKCLIFLNLHLKSENGEDKIVADITYLDDDTIRWILVFMYMDRLDDLHSQTTFKLKAVACKYKISTLKDKCCCVSKDNIYNNNVCEIMLFAELHQNKDLKRIAQDYVVENYKDEMISRE